MESIFGRWADATAEQGHPALPRWRIVVSACVLVFLTATAARADCSVGICQTGDCPTGFEGNTCCVIALGTYSIDDSCTLDFGDQTVTIAGSATIRSATAGGVFDIIAKNLILQGLLQAPGGSVSMTVEGIFKTQSVGNSPGKIDIKPGGFAEIVAGGSVILLGKDMSADGNASAHDAGYLSIQGASISVSSPMHANGVQDGSGGEVDLMATGGDLVIGAAITADGGLNGGGFIDANAAGSISVTSPLHASGAQGGSGGYVTLSAHGDTTVTANITVTGSGIASDGGDVCIGPQCDDVSFLAGTITISSTVDARATTSNGDADGTIDIGPACTVRLSGTLKTRNSVLQAGTNSIVYLDSFDATGGTMLADTDGNLISCRCSDANLDGVCDSPVRCNHDPMLANGSLTPTPIIEPVSDPPCGCGNGVLDPGEQCDDGNNLNGDCCSANCGFEAAGRRCASDGNSCTTDQCDGAGACVHPPSLAGTPCRDDGNVCTVDQCDGAGTCVHPAGNAGAVCRWAVDLCDVSETCTGSSSACPPDTFQPDGTVCDDGSTCTTSDACQRGSCVGVAVADGATCEDGDGNPCTAGTCYGGSCVGIAVPDGTPCDDGLRNVCTSGALCSGGSCLSQPVTCDPCCLTHETPGCQSGSCQESCVCQYYPDCCTRQWGDICVWLRTVICDNSCPSCTLAGLTPTATAVDSAAPTATETASATATPSTNEATSTATFPPSVTQTPSDTPTDTATALPMMTPTTTATDSPTATSTAAPTGSTSATPTPPPSLDHFECYKVRVAMSTAQFIPIAGVSLIDEFGELVRNLTRPVSLCNPADRNGSDPTAPAHRNHLYGYQIKTPRNAAPFAAVRRRTVVNQLGTLVVDIVRPTRLLVPSAKSLIGAPTPPIDPALDHFDCYKVRRPKGAEKFEPILGTTTLSNQFGTTTVDVVKPTALCAPANANHEQPGAETHAGRLMCYKVHPVKGSTTFHTITPVFVANHFSSEALDVIHLRELCVPSSESP